MPQRPASATQSASGFDLRPLSQQERESLAAPLSAEERHVILNHGTERPFCGTLLNNKASGMYACRLCGLPLFKADAKFESGTGWPSFYQPLRKGSVLERGDFSHGMSRIEVCCSKCGSHLGHVFEDGPAPTGLRYCMNSVSLKLLEPPKK